MLYTVLPVGTDLLPLTAGLSNCTNVLEEKNSRHEIRFLTVYTIHPNIQGLWKFVAYGDVGAAMNALPRANETLDGAWSRMDLLYESDTEDLSIDPATLKKGDSESWSHRRRYSAHGPARLGIHLSFGHAGGGVMCMVRCALVSV